MKNPVGAVSENRAATWLRASAFLAAAATLLLSPVRVDAKEPSAEADRAVAACADIEGMIDGLVDYTDTKCLPAAAAASAGASFIIISEQPVFSVDASKKGWLLASLGAVGFVLNEERPSFKADEVIFSDVQRMKERTGYVIKVSVLKSLQRKVKADELSLEAAYTEMLSGMRPMTLPERD
jgi:hypothetical protein